MRRILSFSKSSKHESTVYDDQDGITSEFSTTMTTTSENEPRKRKNSRIRVSLNRLSRNYGNGIQRLFSTKNVHLRNVESIVKKFAALKIVESPYDEPYEILDHLYLGTALQSRDIKTLEFVGITHVINCEGDNPKVDTNENFFSKTNIKYIELQCKNDEEYDMKQHVQDAFQFIEECREENGKVFLYSPHGRDTSGFLVVTYCMIFKKWTVTAALQHCCEARGKILMNENFQHQLVQFAKDREMLE